jgi:hypothetical protein
MDEFDTGFVTDLIGRTCEAVVNPICRHPPLHRARG